MQIRMAEEVELPYGERSTLLHEWVSDPETRRSFRTLMEESWKLGHLPIHKWKMLPGADVQVDNTYWRDDPALRGFQMRAFRTFF